MRSCAKIILLGEHAVVYGKPGIALPILSLSTEVVISQGSGIKPDRILNDEEKKRLEALVGFAAKRFSLPDFQAAINTNIPFSAGLGSSASLCVALVKEINRHFRLGYDEDTLNSASQECEKIFHSNPSGIDNTVCFFEKPVFFESGRKHFLKPGKMNFVLAYTGQKPPTSEMIAKVRHFSETSKREFSDVLDTIGRITMEARKIIEAGDQAQLGKLMSQNHAQLQRLELSTPKLDLFCEVAISNGAYGAKIAGAGGGGYMIALVPPKNQKVAAELGELAPVIEVRL